MLGQHYYNLATCLLANVLSITKDSWCKNKARKDKLYNSTVRTDHATENLKFSYFNLKMTRVSKTNQSVKSKQ